MKVFRDRVRNGEMLSVGVEGTSRTIRFIVENVMGILPAMHYFEAHPDMAGRFVEIELTDRIAEPSANALEVYNPQLIRDDDGKNLAYKNYNFVVLNKGMAHAMSEVIAGYAEFLAMLKDGRQRKVKIVERPEIAFALLEKIGRMKPDADYVVHSKAGHTTRIYLTAGSTSKGMTNRLGIDSANADLEKRIELR